MAIGQELTFGMLLEGRVRSSRLKLFARLLFECLGLNCYNFVIGMVILAAVDSLIGKALRAGINRRAEAVGRAVPSCMRRMLGSLRPFYLYIIVEE